MTLRGHHVQPSMLRQEQVYMLPGFHGVIVTLSYPVVVGRPAGGQVLRFVAQVTGTYFFKPTF